MSKSESVILCEGYHDRAFWAGWLEHLNCTDPGVQPAGKTARGPVYDPWEVRVSQGQFAFLSRSGRFLRIIPCQGKSKILRAARTRLNERSTKRLDRLVINLDSDVNADGSDPGPTGLRLVDLEAFIREIDPAARMTAGGHLAIDGDATQVTLIHWKVDDGPAAGLPSQQTLERLVCAALIAAYPQRRRNVQEWLDSRHQPPPPGVKEFAWSQMAGWYADHGCEDFYRHLRLRASGAWGISEMLAS